jgi:hypothetical protein
VICPVAVCAEDVAVMLRNTTNITKARRRVEARLITESPC